MVSRRYLKSVNERKVSSSAAVRHDSSVVLIGFMATGKTAVGMALAEVLGCRFIDTDRVIEDAQRMTIAEIFDQKGEEAFRDFEKQAVHELASLVKNEQCVIATGGGMVIDPDNMQRLRTFGPMVCLQADPGTILVRSLEADDRKRPLLSAGGDDPRAVIVKLLESRKPYYAQADVCIDTSHQDTQSVVVMVLSRLDRGKGMNVV